MRFSALFDMFTDKRFKADSDASHAVSEFLGLIPERVMQIEFDASRTNKRGIKRDERVYKLGYNLERSVVYVEYYENCNQGQPTIAIYVDKFEPQITITGWKMGKRLFIRYSVIDGKVVKSVRLE